MTDKILFEFLGALTRRQRSKIANHFNLVTNDAKVISEHLGDKLERLICPRGPFTVDEWNELSLPIYGESYNDLQSSITAMIVVGNATITQALRDEDILKRMASYFDKTFEDVIEMLEMLNRRFRGNSLLHYMWDDELSSDKWPQKKALPKKTLLKNDDCSLPIFSLANLTKDELKTFADKAPQYKSAEFKRLVSNTIGAIHQIPRLFYGIDGFQYQLKQIDAYFGRSSGARNHPCDNLYQRVYRAGLERYHNYGMIFARTTLKDCALYEHHGIRLFDELRKIDGLCISNRSISSFGQNGTIEPGFLYITFRILKQQEKPAHVLSGSEIREIIEEYKKELESSGEVEKSLKAGLERANDVNHHGEYKIIDYTDS